jgi:plasmid stability protein
MGQMVVRNLEDSVKAALRQRARRHGRSMEEEVPEILRNAVKPGVAHGGLGTEIAGLFQQAGVSSDIAELRGHEVEPASLEP